VYINFQALGCRLNEAELETWANQFMQLGHQVTTEAAEADVVVFNSCAVTAQADRKSRQQIGRLQRSNPNAALVVTGCHASLNSAAVKNYLGVDLVVDNQQKEQLEDGKDFGAPRLYPGGGPQKGSGRGCRPAFVYGSDMCVG